MTVPTKPTPTRTGMASAAGSAAAALTALSSAAFCGVATSTFSTTVIDSTARTLGLPDDLPIAP